MFARAIYAANAAAGARLLTSVAELLGSKRYAFTTRAAAALAERRAAVRVEAVVCNIGLFTNSLANAPGRAAIRVEAPVAITLTFEARATAGTKATASVRCVSEASLPLALCGAKAGGRGKRLRRLG